MGLLTIRQEWGQSTLNLPPLLSFSAEIKWGKRILQTGWGSTTSFLAAASDNVPISLVIISVTFLFVFFFLRKIKIKNALVSLHSHHVLHISLLSNNQQCTARAPRTHFSLPSLKCSIFPLVWLKLMLRGPAPEAEELTHTACQLCDGALLRKQSLARHRHTDTHTHTATHTLLWRAWEGPEPCPKNHNNPELRMRTVVKRVVIKTRE